jgi:hypothetical protein
MTSDDFNLSILHLGSNIMSERHTYRSLFTIHHYVSRFQYHMLLLLFTNNMTGVTSKKEKRAFLENTSSTPISLWVRVAKSLVVLR